MEFFWSEFTCIRTEYGDLWSKYPYSDRIQENNKPEKTQYLETFHVVSSYNVILSPYI